MKKTLISIQCFLRKAFPLPYLAAGYLCGLSLSLLLGGESLAPLQALPFPASLTALLSVELPIWGLTALAGICRLPSLAALPLFYRSFLWGYGSLLLYLSAGQGALYFRYVVGVGITLIPLCCLTCLAAKTASAPGRLSRTALIDYLCRALFYWGLILLTLLLRTAGGGS